MSKKAKEYTNSYGYDVDAVKKVAGNQDTPINDIEARCVLDLMDNNDAINDLVHEAIGPMVDQVIDERVTE